MNPTTQLYLTPSFLKTAADYSPLCESTTADRLDTCLQIVRQHGLELYTCDLTREDVGVFAVRVVVPGLRPAGPRFAPGRLFDVPVKLGWVTGLVAESDLNPVGMWL